MRVTVMVPTYRRPDDLRRCLAALAAQRRPPDEVVVVARAGDDQTWELLEATERARALALRSVAVTIPGVVHAMNAGLAEIDTEIVAITDDDAAPHPDWVHRIAAHFEGRRELGGVGGRDLLYINNVLAHGKRRVVGKVPRFGRHYGNHHLGFGPPREVDSLKGVNCAYRVGALRPIGFDERLRGSGAQLHWEISLGLSLRRAGWKLLYDPAILVDHFFAQRFDEDQRNTFNALAMQNNAYNETLVRMDQLTPLECAAFMVWAVAIGTHSLPGVVQWLRLCRDDRRLATMKLLTTLIGRVEAWRDAYEHGPRQAVRFSSGESGQTRVKEPAPGGIRL